MATFGCFTFCQAFSSHFYLKRYGFDNVSDFNSVIALHGLLRDPVVTDSLSRVLIFNKLRRVNEAVAVDVTVVLPMHVFKRLVELTRRPRDVLSILSVA